MAVMTELVLSGPTAAVLSRDTVAERLPVSRRFAAHRRV
jgi:hypothetical protein